MGLFVVVVVVVVVELISDVSPSVDFWWNRDYSAPSSSFQQPLNVALNPFINRGRFNGDSSRAILDTRKSPRQATFAAPGYLPPPVARPQQVPSFPPPLPPRPITTRRPFFIRTQTTTRLPFVPSPRPITTRPPPPRLTTTRLPFVRSPLPITTRRPFVQTPPTTPRPIYRPPPTQRRGGYSYPQPTPAFPLPTTPRGPIYVQDENRGGETINVQQVYRQRSPPSSESKGVVGGACAAALKCVETHFCSAGGVITSARLTKEEERVRVPLTDCHDKKTGVTGKCCRDPNYQDPWPSANLVNGIDNGAYREDPSLGQYNAARS